MKASCGIGSDVVIDYSSTKHARYVKDPQAHSGQRRRRFRGDRRRRGVVRGYGASYTRRGTQGRRPET